LRASGQLIAEESSLLEAVTGKDTAGGKDLACVIVIYKVKCGDQRWRYN
jgi:hypothetical protein